MDETLLIDQWTSLASRSSEAIAVLDVTNQFYPIRLDYLHADDENATVAGELSRLWCILRIFCYPHRQIFQRRPSVHVCCDDLVVVGLENLYRLSTD